MRKLNSVKIVEDFWAAVWQAHNPDAIDRFVVDDCVITTGGVDIVTKDRFKAWVKQFLDKVADLEFGVVEIFQNEDGSRVRRGNCRPCNRTFFADWFEKRALDIFSKTTDHYFFFFQGLAQTTAGKSKVG